MNSVHSHPTDFSPYLDCNSSEPGYREISAHVENCVSCRKELLCWQSADALFRNHETLQVPAFQWQRIAARIRNPEDRTQSRLPILSRFRKPAWSMALGTLVLAAAAWSGLLLYQNAAEKQLLMAIGRYASEEAKTSPEENPFRPQSRPQSLTDHSYESNPFAVRR